MERYELDYLAEVFKDHSEEFMKSPHYKSEDFNLPCAFKSIIEEIIGLREAINKFTDK